MVGTLPEGHTAQVSVEVSEEVVLTTPSLVVEAPAEVVPPEASAAGPALVVSTASTTLVRGDPPYIPHPVTEKGSGSFLGGEDMGELARQMCNNSSLRWDHVLISSYVETAPSSLPRRFLKIWL